MDRPTAAELIRQDLAPTLFQLYFANEIVGRYLAVGGRPLPRSRPTSHGAPSGHFMALNYGLLGSVVALAAAIGLLLVK